MSSYREKLLDNDERGIPVFSPMCNPDATFIQDTNSFHLNNFKTSKSRFDSIESINSNLNSEFIKSDNSDYDCKVSNVYFPVENNNQFPKNTTSHDWFSDPTYAEIVAMKKEENPSNENLKTYRLEKAMEKITKSLMQTL